MAEEFYPVFKADDFINLPKYCIYLKLLIDGMASKPFSAMTMPIPQVNYHVKEIIIAHSRQQHSKEQYLIEALLQNKEKSFTDTDLPTLF